MRNDDSLLQEIWMRVLSYSDGESGCWIFHEDEGSSIFEIWFYRGKQTTGIGNLWRGRHKEGITPLCTHQKSARKPTKERCGIAANKIPFVSGSDPPSTPANSCRRMASELSKSYDKPPHAPTTKFCPSLLPSNQMPPVTFLKALVFRGTDGEYNCEIASSVTGCWNCAGLGITLCFRIFLPLHLVIVTSKSFNNVPCQYILRGQSLDFRSQPRLNLRLWNVYGTFSMRFLLSALFPLLSYACFRLKVPIVTQSRLIWRPFSYDVSKKPVQLSIPLSTFFKGRPSPILKLNNSSYFNSSLLSLLIDHRFRNSQTDIPVRNAL